LKGNNLKNFRIDSKIITLNKQKELLISLFENKIKLNLLMRGSTDGYKNQTFFDKCSKKGKTLVIIQDTNNKIFGGFTNIEWEWNAHWMDEGNKNTFLFSYI
jgi:hypothetical protein